MRRSLARVIVGFSLFVPAPMACSSAVDENTEHVGFTEDATQGSFAYLRCNGTGWNATSANRFVPTSNPNILVLDYAVTLPWLASSADSCLLTQTNQRDGFGTVQTNYQSIGGRLDVPATRSLRVGWQTISVRYPALGAYRATLDLSQRTLSIAPQPTVAWSWPLAGQNGRDWVINNYVDGPAPGLQDYTGGTRTYEGHLGVDIDVSTFRDMDAGVAVLSVGPGEVLSLEESQPDRNLECVSALWNQVTVAAPDGTILTYGHLKRDSVVVEVGDLVETGDVLGLVGSSGCSTQPHLHLEAFDARGDLIDPFAQGLWEAPPAYVVPLQIMDLIVNDYFFSSVRDVIDPSPNIARLLPPYELTVALSVAGGTGGDAPGIRVVLPDGSVYDEVAFPFEGGAAGHTFWYWGWGLGSEPMAGTWRVEALANGVVSQTHTFQIAP